MNDLENRCYDLNTAISSLPLLSAHDTLILLKMSFSAPMMQQTLRYYRASTAYMSLRRRITESTDDHRDRAFLFQRLSVLI